MKHNMNIFSENLASKRPKVVACASKFTKLKEWINLMKSSIMDRSMFPLSPTLATKSAELTGEPRTR